MDMLTGLILGFVFGLIVAGYILHGKYKNLSDILIDKQLMNKLLKDEMRINDSKKSKKTKK